MNNFDNLDNFNTNEDFDMFNMKEIEKKLMNTVFSYSKGHTKDAIDSLYNYYSLQITRLKKSLKKRNDAKKRELLHLYICKITQISDENSYLKNNDNYYDLILNKI